MKTTWIDTDARYQQIIDAPDAETRQAHYTTLFIQPWGQMMAMFAQGSDDPLAGARGWNWLLPDQLDTEPDSLRQLRAFDAWRVGREALEAGAARFAPYAEQMPMESVEGWLVLGDPARSDPVMRGYTGGVDFMAPRLIVQYDTPTDHNLARLGGSIVHEMNHLIRFRLFPWDMSRTRVADYIIHEGVAESFAGALFGQDKVGHYVSEVEPEALDRAKAIIGAGLDEVGFNRIRGYIFGEHWAGHMGIERVEGMPTYGGYAVGYHVVQAFLARTGKTVEAATFTSADEIIAESGYFR